MLLVCAIVATLAAIAVPNYTKAREHALGKEAVANLKLIAAAERIYKLETGNYMPCDCNTYALCTGVTGCNTLLSLNLNPSNWSYSVLVVPGGAIFQVGADRQDGDCVYRLTSNFNNGEPYVASGTCP